MNDSKSRERLLGFITSEIDRRSGGREQPMLKAFAAEVLRGMDFEDLRERKPADVCGTIMWVWGFLQQWDRQAPKIALFNPTFEQHGWTARHTSIVVLTDGMPFVAESLRLELNRRNIVIHMQMSSDLTVQRDEHDHLRHLWQATVEPDGARRVRESLVYIEVSRLSDAAVLEALGASLAEVIADVKTVVSDFEPMCQR